MMLLAAASFFACAAPLPFAWFFVWRFGSGLAGAVLMVLAAPAVLPHVPPQRRGLAGGVIFTGVGLGIAASGTLVPLLLRAGLRETWIGLGTLVARCSRSRPGAAGRAAGAHAERRRGRGPRRAPTRSSARSISNTRLTPSARAAHGLPGRLHRARPRAGRRGRRMALGAVRRSARLPARCSRACSPTASASGRRCASPSRSRRVCVGWLAVGTDPVAGSASRASSSAPSCPGNVVARPWPGARARRRRNRRPRAAGRFATLAFAIGQAAAAYGFSYIFRADRQLRPLVRDRRRRRLRRRWRSISSQAGRASARGGPAPIRPGSARCA